ILALSRYGLDELPAGEQESLTARLLELYRLDPDAGIHGAAEWTLRRWNRGDRLAAIASDLKTIWGRGPPRLFGKGEGQTFAVIDRPDAFRIGSPATDIERNSALEAQRQVEIPRSYAIATREVTVEQFQRFVKTHPRYKMERSVVRYSPNPDGPWIGA